MAQPWFQRKTRGGTWAETPLFVPANHHYHTICGRLQGLASCFNRYPVIPDDSLFNLSNIYLLVFVVLDRI